MRRGKIERICPIMVGEYDCSKEFEQLKIEKKFFLKKAEEL